MSIYWGVISSCAANSTVHTASRDSTLHDFIRLQVQFPQFWGRYSAWNVSQYLLTPEVAAFIFHSTNAICRILVVHYVFNLAGDDQANTVDALNTVDAVNNHGVSLGATIYGDIDTAKKTNSEWFFGWCETMSVWACVNPGGFYYYLSLSNLANFQGPYCAAILDTQNLNPERAHFFNLPLFSSSPLVERSSPTQSRFNGSKRQYIQNILWKNHVSNSFSY